MTIHCGRVKKNVVAENASLRCFAGMAWFSAFPVTCCVGTGGGVSCAPVPASGEDDQQALEPKRTEESESWNGEASWASLTPLATQRKFPQ